MTGGADPTPRPAGAQHATQSGRDNILVQVQGEGSVVNVDQAYLTLTRYRKRHEAGTGPLRLLPPYARLLPLVGREATLDALRAWMGNGRAISARLLVAPAGIGKTRLALALCDGAADAGWDAGFVTERELARFAAARNAGTWGWQRPTLVVVDHAAATLATLRPWLVELAANLADGAPPLRLLLLERHADPAAGWWRELAGTGDADGDAVQSLFDPAAPVALPPIASPADRRAIFAAAMEALDAGHLLPTPDPAFDRHFGAVEWGGEPLHLVLAATAAADAGVGTALALGRADAALKVAAEEVERIRRFAGDAASAPLLAHLAAVATLCGGLARAEALDAVAAERTALRREGARDVRALYDDLRRALPDVASPGAVAPVLPDVVGEAVVLRALGEGDAEEALEAVRRAAGRAWERVAAFVGRAAQGYGEVAAAGGAPLAWLDALVALAGDDRHRLAALAAALPWHTAHLRGRAAAITERLVAAMRADPATPPAALARRLNDLSSRLASVGRGDAALDAAADAVVVWQEVGATDDMARMDHAIALTNLASRLDAAQRTADALRVDEAAVAMLRALAPTPLARTTLAAALANRADRLARTPHVDLALQASLEAVAATREAAALQPESGSSALAAALCTLSHELERCGARDAAVPPADEAVALLRALGAVDPTAYDAQLARALNARSNRLLACGRADDALRSAEEALRTIAPLFLADPPALMRETLVIAGNYRRQLDALARDADAALIEPIERELMRLQRG